MTRAHPPWHRRSVPDQLDTWRPLRESVSEGASGSFFYWVKLRDGTDTVGHRDASELEPRTRDERRSSSALTLPPRASPSRSPAATRLPEPHRGVAQGYIVKQITKREKNTLMSILPYYKAYVKERGGRCLLQCAARLRSLSLPTTTISASSAASASLTHSGATVHWQVPELSLDALALEVVWKGELPPPLVFDASVPMRPPPTHVPNGCSSLATNQPGVLRCDAQLLSRAAPALVCRAGGYNPGTLGAPSRPHADVCGAARRRSFDLKGATANRRALKTWELHGTAAGAGGQGRLS